MKFLPFALLAALALPLAAPAQVDNNRTMITVNGQAIKGGFYYKRMEMLPNVGRVVNQRFQVASPGFLTLQLLVNELLVMQLAKEKQLAPTEAEIQEEINFRKLQEPRLIELIKSVGLSEEDLRYEVTVYLSEFKLATQGINITNQEVETFYRSKIKEYTLPKRWRLRIIGVTTDELQKSVDDALKAGKPFSQVATEFSEDITKVAGGYLGDVPAERLGSAVKDQVMSMQKGQTSGWILSEGLRVKFFVEDILAEQVLPLDDTLKRVIRRNLMVDRGRTRNNVTQMINEFKKRAKFEFSGTPFDQQLREALGVGS